MPNKDSKINGELIVKKIKVTRLIERHVHKGDKDGKLGRLYVPGYLIGKDVYVVEIPKRNK